MKCKGCGSELKLIEYQARSADEAHSSAYRCPHCPLSINKFSNTSKCPHLYLKRFSRSNPRTPTIDSSNTVLFKRLCVKSKAFQSYTPSQRQTSKACNYIDLNNRLFKSYATGPWRSTARCTSNKEYVGLNAWTELVQCIPNAPFHDIEYEDFDYVCIEDYIGIVEGDSIVFTVDIPVQDESLVLFHLAEIYLMGASPSSLSQYVDKILLASMSNLNARAYDTSSVQDHDHLFSTKPDGERMWLVKSGSTWLYCRRLLNFQVVGWYIDAKISYTKKRSISCVLDLEVMLSHPSILIDILCDENGKISPYDRDLKWIHDRMFVLVSCFPYLECIHVRKFFMTYADADAYSRTVSYPIDGLIAILGAGTDMKKLKPIKSMELEVSKDNTLVTKEGTALLRLDRNSTYAIGTIVEIRFSIINNKIQIYDSFQRFDKQIANGDAAVDSIIASCNSSMSDGEIRTVLWRWSNKLRFSIYQRASKINSSRNIILDIGSGSGQSSEAFAKLENCSFILVEPDDVKCKMLAQRLEVKQVYKDPRSIIGAVSALKQGTRKYHILNTTLDRVITDKPVMTNMSQIIKCAIASFSLQFIAEEIDALVSSGIPFIGCYYSYHDVDVGGYIVNTPTIKMKKISDIEATVRWGSDKVYKEPVVNPMVSSLVLSSIDALDMVPCPVESSTSPIYHACSHVKVLISR